MNEVLNFLKECRVFYLATVEGDQPRVRPFGAFCEFEGKLYIVTSNQKKVYHQMMENPKVELSGMTAQGKWIRITGKACLDDRREARVAMMEANKEALSAMYSPDDNLMVVFAIEEGTATFCSFTEAPVEIQF